MSCGEFELIARYFNRRTRSRRDVELGIGDDCALLSVPEKQTLAISTDTLVAGVHFLRDIHPADLGYKALAESQRPCCHGRRPCLADAGLNAAAGR